MTPHDHAVALRDALDREIAATSSRDEQLLLKRIRGSVNVYVMRDIVTKLASGPSVEEVKRRQARAML